MPALTPADLELLSAYLDNELSPAERAALERRLAAEPALVAELETLRSVVIQARALSLLKAPRDFRLDPAVYKPAVYGRPAARPAARRDSTRRVTPVQRAYRWSSAISALAAVLVLALGVVGLLNRGDGLLGAIQPQMAAGSLDEERDASAVAVLPTQAATSTLARTLPPTPTALASVADGVEESAGVNAAVLLTATPAIMALEVQESPAQIVSGQPAPSGMGGATFKETPNGFGGGEPLSAPPGMLQPQATPAAATDLVAPQASLADGAIQTGAGTTDSFEIGVTQAGEAEAAAGAAVEAFNAADAPTLSAPTPTAAFDFGQRLAATATRPPALPSPVQTRMALTQEALAQHDALVQTLARDAAVTTTPTPLPAVEASPAVAGAVVSTGTPLVFQPTAQPAPAEPASEPAGADEAHGETWASPGLPVEALLGGGLALLALSGLLYALSRRAG